MPTEKSEVSHVTLDGKAATPGSSSSPASCELNQNVAAYVKNDHLGFTIPYVHKGRSHSYLPDFLVRLERADGDDVDAHPDRRGLRQPEEPGPTKAKADTARDHGASPSTTTAASAAGATSR